MLTIFKNILLKMLRVICILNFKFDKRFLFEKENLMDYSVDIHYIYRASKKTYKDFKERLYDI